MSQNWKELSKEEKSIYGNTDNSKTHLIKNKTTEKKLSSKCTDLSLQEEARKKANKGKNVKVCNVKITEGETGISKHPLSNKDRETKAFRRGMINKGNDCCLNALLQCLATTPLGELKENAGGEGNFLSRDLGDAFEQMNAKWEAKAYYPECIRHSLTETFPRKHSKMQARRLTK